MSDQHEQSPSFATQLDHLFRTVSTAEGRLYSNRMAAAKLTAGGCPISHTQVGALRRGDADPRRSEMLAFANMFGKPVSYFLDDPSSTVDSPTLDHKESRRLIRALQDPDILSVAMRMGDTGMSATGKAAVLAMIEHVLAIERQARQQPPAPGG